MFFFVKTIKMTKLFTIMVGIMKNLRRIRNKGLPFRWDGSKQNKTDSIPGKKWIDGKRTHSGEIDLPGIGQMARALRSILLTAAWTVDTIDHHHRDGQLPGQAILRVSSESHYCGAGWIGCIKRVV